MQDPSHSSLCQTSQEPYEAGGMVVILLLLGKGLPTPKKGYMYDMV